MLSKYQKILFAKSLGRSPVQSPIQTVISPPMHSLCVVDQYYQYISSPNLNQIIVVSRIRNTSEISTYHHITISAVPSRYIVKCFKVVKHPYEHQLYSLSTHTGRIYALSPQQEGWIVAKIQLSSSAFKHFDRISILFALNWFPQEKLQLHTLHSIPQYSYIASVACILHHPSDIYSKEYLTSTIALSTVRYYLECKEAYAATSYMMAKPIEYMIIHILNIHSKSLAITTSKSSGAALIPDTKNVQLSKDLVLECWEHITKEWMKETTSSGNMKRFSSVILYSYQRKYNIIFPSNLTISSMMSNLTPHARKLYDLLRQGLFSQYLTISIEDSSKDRDVYHDISNSNRYERTMHTNPFLTILDINYKAVDQIGIYRDNNLDDILSHIHKYILLPSILNADNVNYHHRKYIHNRRLIQALVYQVSKQILQELQLLTYASYQSNTMLQQPRVDHYSTCFMNISNHRIDLQHMTELLESQIDTDIAMSLLQSLFI